ncbi:hypothetical protein [Salinibacter phage M8CR30-4]|uniref:Uncharacterized protein n=2 Tax=Holosalinivirus M8CR302 TaxID=2041855 RepID=A0A2I6UGL4_9CAUD|nr:hypothetical protein FGG64_gp05 [Salinibacter phage M8CR30-2]AUO79057.1 hypothetical protein [Salinibacter phage M8CR30-2]AUO79098.1 hypothetical protein [Salinibacter phage M8CR30-4]
MRFDTSTKVASTNVYRMIPATTSRFNKVGCFPFEYRGRRRCRNPPIPAVQAVPTRNVAAVLNVVRQLRAFDQKRLIAAVNARRVRRTAFKLRSARIKRAGRRVGVVHVCP